MLWSTGGREEKINKQVEVLVQRCLAIEAPTLASLEFSIVVLGV